MIYRTCAMLLMLFAHADAFAAGRQPLRSNTRSAVRMQEDPTGSPFIKAINAFQEAIQQSPAANFKAKLAKMQAGDYDEVAVKAKLDAYMAEPAVMFSFTT